METTGTITKILPIEKGTSKTGTEWQKQSFILDNNEKYNNIFCFEIFGADKVESFNKYNKVGSTVKVDFNVQTNEWKGKYFTSLQAWKVFKADDKMTLEQGANIIDAAFEPAGALNEKFEDDLPF